MRQSGRSRGHNRRGATLVETAIVLSTFFVFVFGMLEMSRLGMASQLVTDAAREGCRVAIINGQPQTEVTDRVQSILNAGGIRTYTVTSLVNGAPGDVTTSKLGDQVTVNISVQFRDISWLPTPRYLGSATLSSSATMSSERP